MRGQIYKIHNPVNKNTYIGSTIQKCAKKRFYRHRQKAHTCPRSGCLFDGEVEFNVISEVDVNTIQELRELEQVFIKIAENSEDTCINKNMSYVPDYLKKQRINEQKQKYKKTAKGLKARKWQNYRHQCRKKINSEIKLYFSK